MRRKKNIERQVREELMLPEEEAPRKERKPLRVREGVGRVFADMNGAYEKARGFYRDLNKMFGNTKDPFAK